MQEALDQVDVGEDHAAAAVAVELEFGERLALGAPFDEKREVCVPLVADDLAAAKAAHRNNPVSGRRTMVSVGEAKKARGLA